MSSARDQIVFWMAASVLGLSSVLQLDALTIALRGSAADSVLLAHMLATSSGLLAGLTLWVVGRALLALGALLAGISRRFDGPALSPLLPVIAFATLVATWALSPAHRVFSQHPATTALLMVYLPFPLATAFTGAALLLRTGRFRAPSVTLAAAGIAGLHAMNVWYYPGLYRPVHDALTGVALGVAVIAAAIALTGVTARTRARVLAVTVALALVAPLFVSSSMRLRGLAFFEGTELHHTLHWAEAAFDFDGDGFRSGLGGDCDDSRRDVNPLRLERPGNGVDDNCRLGDRRGAGLAASTRRAQPAAALATWRAQHPQPNVVLVLVDTLRADFVGALGSKRGLTPALDAFAATATVFEQARTTSPRTAAALVSIVGARFHGRNLSCRVTLMPAQASLQQRLAAQGYSAVARLVGDNWAGTPAAEGWTQMIQRGTPYEVTGPAVTDDGLALISQLQRPFLLLLHYLDPHSPYRASADVPRRGTGIAAEYGAEVESTDREVGRFLRGLQASERSADTVVVVFADHGENLGERGSRGGHHGVSVYDEDVHVPLMVRVPGMQARRIGAPVSLVDIAPTVLELVGAPALADSDGRSLAGYLLGEPPPATWTLSEYYEPPYYLRAVVADRFKLIADTGNNVSRLFDVRADPGEHVDVAGLHRDRVASLTRELDRWIETRGDPSEPAPALCAY